jgi:hypothetical protein
MVGSSRISLMFNPGYGAVQVRVALAGRTMNTREFLQSIRVAVYKAAAKGTVAILTRPPGRRPDPALVSCSKWFNGLKREDRDIVAQLVDMAAKQATYNFLLALDGLIALEPPGSKGRLELFFSKGDVRVRLNDESAELLTSLFKE